MAVVIPLKAELVIGLTKLTSLDEVINTDEFTLTDITTKHPRRYNHTTDEGREAIQYSQ